MPRTMLATNVFDTAIERLVDLYAQGHRLIISFSAGKDSGVVLELAIIAASMTGRLPVEVQMRDEEIMFPGTFEYAERVMQRPEVDFHWLIAHQPVTNVYNRREPYFWVFDPLLPPDQWVRPMPDYATPIKDLPIQRIVIPERFPPDPGKNLYAVVGMRTAESLGRFYGLHSARGYITKPNPYGVSNVWPIYDWADGDVWKSISDLKWDYNRSYDVLNRMGLPRKNLRIAPPTLNAAGAESLQVAARAWPQWFDAVCDRLPGVRQVALFGKHAIIPHRREGETWEQCFKRECIDDAPAAWIAERSTRMMEQIVGNHSHHSTHPLPDVHPCYTCKGNLGSWKSLAMAMYGGDPFSLKAGQSLPYVEPEFFRPGAGTWGGSPTFS